MSHNLDFSRGKAAIAYNAKNGKPWHGFGEHIEAGMSADEIAKIAGLDYGVRKSPVIYNIPNPAYPADGVPLPEGWAKRFGKLFDADKNEVTPMLAQSYENRAVVYRDDTGDALSVMSESHYTPAQPIDLLNGLMELTKGSGYEMDVCGALKGGKVVWGLAARTDGEADVGFGDIIKPYVLLLTSYDGTYARTGRLTNIRAVCQNTVSLSALVDGDTTAKQRNSAEFDLEKANLLFANLAQHDEAFGKYVELTRAMAKVRVSDDIAKRFFSKLYMPKSLKDENDWMNTEWSMDADGVTANQRTNVSTMLDLFRDSPGASLETANGTLWGMFNAVTFYQDHSARTKENKRWESATIGQGNTAKDKALALAIDTLSR